MKISALAFNGTYNYDFRSGVHVDPKEMLSDLGIAGCRYIPSALGKENSFQSLQPVFDELVAGNDVLVFCGTDNIEEIGYLFALNRPRGSRVFLMGTMFPLHHPDYDMEASVRSLIAASKVAGEGAWIIVGDSIVSGVSARKARSDGHGAITPAIDLASEAEALVDQEPKFCIFPERLDKVVPIVFVALGDRGEWVDWGRVDALVIAGSGTGSIPNELKKSILAHGSGRRIAVSTRCMEGPNHNNRLYPGSAAAYEAQGFEVEHFNGLNPMQARIRLILELSQAD